VCLQLARVKNSFATETTQRHQKFTLPRPSRGDRAGVAPMTTASPNQRDDDASMRRGRSIGSHIMDSNESRKEIGRQMNDVLSAKHITKIGTWNVRTAYSTGKLAQIINEMKTSGLHILGLAEMRWPDSGQFVSEDVTVLYSGGDKHEQGVGILTSREAAKGMIGWEPVSESIVTLRLRTRFTCATIIQVYAPTDTAAVSDKEVFYQQLDAVMDSIPSYDMKILMGDFNAQIGPDTTGFENVIGKEALGQRRDNGEITRSL